MYAVDDAKRPRGGRKRQRGKKRDDDPDVSQQIGVEQERRSGAKTFPTSHPVAEVEAPTRPVVDETPPYYNGGLIR